MIMNNEGTPRQKAVLAVCTALKELYAQGVGDDEPLQREDFENVPETLQAAAAHQLPFFARALIASLLSQGQVFLILDPGRGDAYVTHQLHPSHLDIGLDEGLVLDVTHAPGQDVQLLVDGGRYDCGDRFIWEPVQRAAGAEQANYLWIECPSLKPLVDSGLGRYGAEDVRAGDGWLYDIQCPPIILECQGDRDCNFSEVPHR